MLEASLAASISLSDGRAASQPMLTAVSIPAPLILPEPARHKQMTNSLAVQVTLSMLSGSMQLESTEYSSCQRTVHLAGTIAPPYSISVTTTGAQAIDDSPASKVLRNILSSSSSSNSIGCKAVAGAMGFVTMTNRSEPSFRCHPAAVDNSMHLALYVGRADGRTRVPGMGPALHAACMAAWDVRITNIHGCASTVACTTGRC